MTDKKNGREYLGYVLEKLKERITEISLSLVEGQKEIEGMHEYYWENYTEMDQYGYENYDNQQALFHQMHANEEQFLLRKRFKKMLDSPFFGRVDFVYDGDDEPEIFYIGIGNLSETAGHRPLVYDWRAPVSSLFYDYDKGPAAYEAPSGTFSGEVVSKWQYKIRRGKMIYEFESDVKIDDEILGAELGSKGEVQLKNIVRTIQKEQNAIIRNTKDRIMVIQGAAGRARRRQPQILISGAERDRPFDQRSADNALFSPVAGIESRAQHGDLHIAHLDNESFVRHLLDFEKALADKPHVPLVPAEITVVFQT